MIIKDYKYNSYLIKRKEREVTITEYAYKVKSNWLWSVTCWWLDCDKLVFFKKKRYNDLETSENKMLEIPLYTNIQGYLLCITIIISLKNNIIRDN